MARLKERGQLVGDIHWFSGHHEVAIRMYQKNVFLTIRAEVARLGAISRYNQTAHLLKMIKFRVNERDRHGRISTFIGCAFQKQIDGMWYDLAMETEDYNDGCLRLVLREHRPWTGHPDERYFILHKESDNANAIESFKHHNYFLKVDQNTNNLCMIRTPRHLLTDTDGLHPLYKFEIFFDPPSIFLPDSEIGNNTEEIDPVPHVINYRYRQFVEVIEVPKTKSFTFKNFMRIFTCRP